MNKWQSRSILSLFSILVILGGASCNLPTSTNQISESDQVLTAAAETVAVQIAQIRTLQSPTVSIPTNTPEPKSTESTSTSIPVDSPAATATKVPCNAAKFVVDMTIPDNTEIVASNSFTKTWRLQNIGTCEWTSGYELVWDHGDRMDAPEAVRISNGSIKPGESTEMSVDLTAPADPGTYRADFLLRSSDGVLFGIGEDSHTSFFVKIKVVLPTPTTTNTALPSATPTATVDPQPDLMITSFTLDPTSPIKDQPVHISITVMNKGNAVTGAYKVKWWAGEGYSDPGCIWDIDSSNPNGGRTLECDYPGYPSQYSAIETRVFADADNTVVESDEANNVSTMTVEVLSP